MRSFAQPIDRPADACEMATAPSRPSWACWLLATTSLTVLAMPGAVLAQDAEGDASERRSFEVITVTAQKREETLQDAALSLQVLDSTVLDREFITDFEEYVSLLPSVSFNSVGPGSAQVYIRGISDGGDGNASGSQPSVGLYLDDQPITAIGRNLDVHIYDIARIEVLGGPQGTLYGANSQAGTLRIITNQPDTTEFEAGFDVTGEAVEQGDLGYVLEGFVNVPLSDRIALRVAGWHEETAGYIDAVAATKTFTRSGITVDNDGFVEEDFNVEETTGARAALKIDLNDSWTATARVLHQQQKTTGVWDHDPEDVGDLEVERFFNDEAEDTFTQAGILIEGQVKGFGLSYSGSILDREIDSESDYSEYAEYSSFIDYYTCYYAYDYNAGAYAFYACDDPRIQFREKSQYERETHEFRLTSPEDRRLRLIAGLFYQRSEHDYLFDYRIPTIKPGFQIREPNTYFVTDQLREDIEKAAFGELTFDITDYLSITGGARFFEVESSIVGEVGTVFGLNQINVDTDETGELFKINVSYEPTDDLLFYATWSEGFRPGGVNRESTANIPLTYESDFVTNYEIGWKTLLADGVLRLNGAAFLMEWEDVQFTRFDPSESQLGLTANAGDAQVLGVEVDAAWLVTDNWTLTAAATYLNAELSEDFRQDVTPGAPIDAADGTELPFIPDFKGYINSRYTFGLWDYDGAFNLTYSYVGSTFNDLFTATREEQDAYGILSSSVSFARDGWTGSFYIRNLTDERAELYRNATDIDERITTNQPRTFGLTLGKRF